MLIFVFFIFLSCAKQLNIATASKIFENQSCEETLRKYMKASGCDKFEVTQSSQFDVVFQCYKKDEDKKTFWDIYVFRVSPPLLKYDEKSQEVIDNHTICLDDKMRIEAYHPRELGK